VTVGYGGPGFNYTALQDADNDGYAANCDPNDSNPNIFPTRATCTTLTISGPPAVNESSTAVYTATATWSDGTTSGAFFSTYAETKTPTWSVSPTTYASIGSATGVLSTLPVPSTQKVDVTASLTADGTTCPPGILNVTINKSPTLTVNLSGSGGGTVNSTIPASGLIVCSWPHQPGDICSTVQPYGTLLTLNATQDSSTLVTWSGCDSTNLNSCNITLTSDRTVTTTFTYVKPVRIDRSNPLREYDSIQAAYDDQLTVNGDVILAREFTFIGNLNLNKTKNITIKGGFAPDYVARPGYSLIKGVMTVGKGSVVTDRLTVK
jgi:hypothetical protein